MQMKSMSRQQPGRARTDRCNTSGFTLIEMAIVITIVGIFLAAAVQPYSLYLKNRAITSTKGNVAAVTAAIGDYRKLNGFYPCPASLTDVRGSVTYGHATDCSAGAVVAAGTFQQTSNRSVNFKPTGTGAPAPFAENPKVRLGAIPFRELNLDESQMLDGYNDRIYYAVTERLTNTQTFQPDGGGIGIVDGNGAPVLAVQDTAHFFIFSAGANMAGAYTRDGVLAQACPAAGPEALNCGAGAKPVYAAAQTKSVSGATHFDDVTSYFTSSDMPLWEYSPNLHDIHQKPGGNVGAASLLTTPLAGAYKAVIPGAVHVSNNALIQNLCDNAGANCFASSKIAGGPLTVADKASGTTVTGSQSGMACPAGQYMTGISHGAPVCKSEVFATCPAGQVVAGVTAGVLKCSTPVPPPAPCASAVFKMCATGDTLLPPTASGGSVTKTAGANRKQKFTCNNGVWTAGAASGSCTCTPGVVTSGALPCGLGFAGTYTTTTTTVCPAGTQTTTNTKATTCVCDPTATKNQTLACPSRFAGSIVQQATWQCPAAAWGAWVTLSNTCTCVPNTATQTLPCTAGLTGKGIMQHNDFTCPAGTWGGWVTDSTDCSCVPATDTKTDVCPSGQIGTGITSTRNFTCPGGAGMPGSWSGWTVTSTDCSPAPPVICHWDAISSGVSRLTGIGPAVGSQCTCGDTGPCSSSLGSSYMDYTSCQCN